jgi:hypothetical protein
MNDIEFTLTKVEQYTLKPFGRFKFSTRESNKPNVLSTGSVHVFSGMPYNKEQEKAITKFMIKNKTDILINEYGEFFTIFGSVFTEITHRKLVDYKGFLRTNNLEDNEETWDGYMLTL